MNDQQIKIVIVDDHNLFRKGLIKLINLGDKNNRYQILFEAQSGEELIIKLGQTNVLPDIILTDIEMQEMSGFVVVQWLKKNHPSIKILVITMFESEEAVMKMVRLNVDGYLSKDIEVEDMHQALEAISNGGNYYPKFVTDIVLTTFKEDDSQEGSSYKKKEKILSELSDNERKFLELVCTDLKYYEIAEKMYLSPKTIDGYREELFRKFKVKNRVGLAMCAVRYGLVVL